MNNSVLLRHENNFVDMAKLFTVGSSEPKTVLHGIPLSNFARENEHLVVIYHVQIFKEFIKVQYPYSYGGSEAPPSLLGDLNVLGKHFKALIAWDYNKVVNRNMECHLLDQPRTVSKRILSSVGGDHDSDEDEKSSFQARNQKQFSRLHAKRNLSSVCLPVSDRRLPEVFVSDGKSDSDSTDSILLRTSNSNSVFESEPQTQRTGMDGDAAGESSRDLCSESEEVESRRRNHNRTARDRANDDNDDCSVEEHAEQQPDLDDDSLLDESVDADNCVKRLPFPKKRAYVYHTRKRSITQGPRDLRKRRKVLSERLDNPFLRSRLQCCKKRKCFERINPIYAFKTYKQIMGMNREDFKSFLISLYHPREHSFMLQGHKVCARYLQKGFGFSNDLQCSVKSTPCAPAGPTASALPRLKSSKKKDFIINFLLDYADECGDMMPNLMFTNLPEVRRRDVYEKLKQYCRMHSSREEPPSLNFFYAVWKSHCQNVRTRRNHGFTR